MTEHVRDGVADVGIYILKICAVVITTCSTLAEWSEGSDCNALSLKFRPALSPGFLASFAVFRGIIAVFCGTFFFPRLHNVWQAYHQTWSFTDLYSLCQLLQQLYRTS